MIRKKDEERKVEFRSQPEASGGSMTFVLVVALMNYDGMRKIYPPGLCEVQK